MREIGDDAMAVLQAHDWPGNVRQLRNIVERLLILASDDVTEAITADLLPSDLGSGAGRRQERRSGDLAAAARGARDLRARISDGADQPLRRQHLAHRRLHRHGALGAAPQAEVAGRGLGAELPELTDADEKMVRQPRARRAASPMSTAAICRTAQAGVHIEDRGLQLADGIYEVCLCSTASCWTRTPISTAWSARLRELGMPMPMAARR